MTSPGTQGRRKKFSHEISKARGKSFSEGIGRAQRAGLARSEAAVQSPQASRAKNEKTKHPSPQVRGVHISSRWAARPPASIGARSPIRRIGHATDRRGWPVQTRQMTGQHHSAIPSRVVLAAVTSPRDCASQHSRQREWARAGTGQAEWLHRPGPSFPRCPLKKPHKCGASGTQHSPRPTGGAGASGPVRISTDIFRLPAGQPAHKLKHLPRNGYYGRRSMPLMWVIMTRPRRSRYSPWRISAASILA